MSSHDSVDSYDNSYGDSHGNDSYENDSYTIPDNNYGNTVSELSEDKSSKGRADSSDDHTNSLSSRDEILDYAFGGSCVNEVSGAGVNYDSESTIKEPWAFAPGAKRLRSEDSDTEAEDKTLSEDESEYDSEVVKESSTLKRRLQIKKKRNQTKQPSLKYKGSSDDDDEDDDSEDRSKSKDSVSYLAKQNAEKRFDNAGLAILLGVFFFILLILLFLPGVDRRMAQHIPDWRYRLFCKVLFFVIIFVMLLLIISKATTSRK
jgi:hypothetical protein